MIWVSVLTQWFLLRGDFAPPGDIWGGLEIFWLSQPGELLVPSVRQRTEMLLSSQECI